MDGGLSSQWSKVRGVPLIVVERGRKPRESTWKCDGLNMDRVSYLKKCDRLNRDCVSYLKDRIRVCGHLKIGDTVNNARLEREYLGV